MASAPSRMLELLSLLQARRDWAGDDLADRLQVSPRTIRRDVDRLRVLGYRIDAARGPAGGYRLAAGSDLPPLLFDDEQAVAVALALAVAPATGAAIADAATRALATVRQVMPPRLRHRVDSVAVVAAPGRDSVDPEVLVAVSDATRRREVLRFDYASPSSDRPPEVRPPLRVEPHSVVARGGRWYLLAWLPELQEWRTYRLDRMTPRSPTGVSFPPRDIPGGDAAAFVESRFRGGDGSSGWPCVGTAELDIPAASIQPYLDAEDILDPLPSRRCRLTAGSWSWNALAARLAGMDTNFRIVGPPELIVAAEMLAERLRSASADRRSPHPEA